MRTIDRPSCILCGSAGKPLYNSVTDIIFGTPGEWSLYKCMNKKCNLIWLNPSPLEEDIGTAYKNYYTHHDPEIKESFFRKIYRNIQLSYLSSMYGYGDKKNSVIGNLLYFDNQKLQETQYKVMYLKNIKGKLLDIGCGSGEFLQFMKTYGWDVTGVDFDEKALKVAYSKGIKVHFGKLEDQQFSDSHFDAVTLSHVFEHVYDPVSLICECKRILKPGGRLVLATPNTESLLHKLFKKDWRGLEPPRHIQMYTLNSLQEIFRQAGLPVEKGFTSSRATKFFFKYSVSVRNKKDSIFTGKILPEIFFIIETILLKFNKKLGEEVIMIGRKE